MRTPLGDEVSRADPLTTALNRSVTRTSVRGSTPTIMTPRDLSPRLANAFPSMRTLAAATAGSERTVSITGVASESVRSSVGSS